MAFPVAWSCGCSLENGRCVDHAAKMRAIHVAYYAGDVSFARRVYAASDGFGPHTDPDSVGWDWSGIRDSTTDAVDAMFAMVKGVK